MGQPIEPLSARPIGYLLARAAKLRAMAETAHAVATAATLVSLAERFEALAAKRLGLPDDPSRGA